MTEFDELFRVAYSAMVETLVEAAHQKAQKETSKKKNGKRTKAQVEQDNEHLQMLRRPDRSDAVDLA